MSSIGYLLRAKSVVFCVTVLALTGCKPTGPGEENVPPGTTPYEVSIPPFFPPMDIPPDNPMTVEGIALGRLLFWEKGLSLDSTLSCASCHLPEFAFSDPSPVSTGVNGAQGTRNAMALINMGWAQHFFWDGRATTLEEQILDPIPHPDEMNLPWSEAEDRLAADEDYAERFKVAFGEEEVTAENVSKAIAQFLRTMISSDSKFDRWRRGQESLTEMEFMGYEIFNREGGDPEVVSGGQFGGDCFHCHGEAGLQFSDYLFHNNGLDSNFSNDAGLAGITGQSLDSGRFRTPTLRNVMLSPPYMHDGRFQTIEEVIDHYNSGGQPSATIDPFMKYNTGGLMLQPVQKEALIAFLHTLTDTAFASNPAFSDPH
ncbi:MAG: cytochrome-c peroxidase [Flavobacteriales bacterium]|nr:cytochrome-c peroxidase [Flavobacteriales bacterium]